MPTSSRPTGYHAIRRAGCPHPAAWVCTAVHTACHCEAVTDVTAVAIRIPSALCLRRLPFFLRRKKGRKERRQSLPCPFPKLKVKSVGRDPCVPPHTAPSAGHTGPALQGIVLLGSGGAEPLPYAQPKNQCNRADVGIGPYAQVFDRTS